jgi:hypothetical protein
LGHFNGSGHLVAEEVLEEITAISPSSFEMVPTQALWMRNHLALIIEHRTFGIGRDRLRVIDATQDRTLGDSGNGGAADEFDVGQAHVGCVVQDLAVFDHDENGVAVAELDFVGH